MSSNKRLRVSANVIVSDKAPRKKYGLLQRDVFIKISKYLSISDNYRIMVILSKWSQKQMECRAAKVNIIKIQFGDIVNVEHLHIVADNNDVMQQLHSGWRGYVQIAFPQKPPSWHPFENNFRRLFKYNSWKCIEYYYDKVSFE